MGNGEWGMRNGEWGMGNGGLLVFSESDQTPHVPRFRFLFLFFLQIP